MMNKLLYLAVLIGGLSIGARAQEVSYFDYEALPNVLLESLRKAEASNFISLESLKANCVSAVKEEAIDYGKLPAPYKKKLSPEQLAKQIRPSSLMICKLKRGFGIHEDFVIIGASAVALSEDGLCVSNYHVFEPFIDEGQGIMPQDSLFFVADANGEVYPILGVENYSEAADLAVFKIDVQGRKLVPAPLGQDQEVGARVHTMTHPNQQAYYYTQGVVSRNSAFVNNEWENRCEITADYAIGSSGGPVFDDRGNLISIVSSTNSIYAGGANAPEWQMVMKITIPVSSLKKLVEGKEA